MIMLKKVSSPKPTIKVHIGWIIRAFYHSHY